MGNQLLMLGLLGHMLAQTASGCKCQVSLSACDEVASSDVVFAGTVESIEPLFLSRWSLANTSSLRPLNDAYIEAQDHPSPESLQKLKEIYLKTFPDLSAEEKEQASGAKSIRDINSSFYFALDRGMRVRFRIRTVFKHQEDDDQSDADDDIKELDVWNPFGDCGLDFQTGETYVVYANIEEGSDYTFTDACTRTRRLSDAGEDLSYLMFYKNDREQSAHLEGFTTSDAKSQGDFDPLHEPVGLKSPVTDALIELRSGSLVRYTQPDKNGKFVFDGLPGGEYQVSAFAEGYPMFRQLLAAPRHLQIQEKSCARQVLLIPAPQRN